jgi:hypothetical protein
VPPRRAPNRGRQCLGPRPKPSKSRKNEVGLGARGNAAPALRSGSHLEVRPGFGERCCELLRARTPQRVGARAREAWPTRRALPRSDPSAANACCALCHDGSAWNAEPWACADRVRSSDGSRDLRVRFLQPKTLNADDTDDADDPPGSAVTTHTTQRVTGPAGRGLCPCAGAADVVDEQSPCSLLSDGLPRSQDVVTNSRSRFVRVLPCRTRPRAREHLGARAPECQRRVGRDRTG